MGRNLEIPAGFKSFLCFFAANTSKIWWSNPPRSLLAGSQPPFFPASWSPLIGHHKSLTPWLGLEDPKIFLVQLWAFIHRGSLQKLDPFSWWWFPCTLHQTPPSPTSQTHQLEPIEGIHIKALCQWPRFAALHRDPGSGDRAGYHRICCFVPPKSSIIWSQRIVVYKHISGISIVSSSVLLSSLEQRWVCLAYDKRGGKRKIDYKNSVYQRRKPMLNKYLWRIYTSTHSL